MAGQQSLPGVWQFGLHEELLGTLCWVEVALPGHALHLLQLASLGSRLYVPAASKLAITQANCSSDC